MEPMVEANEETVFPTAVKSLQDNERRISVTRTDSRVNGAGVWSSWEKSFVEPEKAILDLFDNCIDATLHDDFVGKIDIFRDIFECDQSICMRNNCAREIPSLEHVLEAYGSVKSGEQIGENGIGIKQSCAALSDLSIIVTKNNQTVSIGVINKSLQTHGVCLFSYTLEYAMLHSTLDRILFDDGDFCDSLALFGGSETLRGRERLVNHIEALFEMNDDHVFLVVLHKLRHGNEDGGVVNLLTSVAKLLPKTYLHVPTRFEVKVDGTKLQFNYWERRLAEIHCFPLLVDPSNHHMVADDWHEPLDHHMVYLYIGFDPIRACHSANKASLYMYSRKSGRLIKNEQDARGLLKLANSGSSYAQGLTVIVDDFGGQLPLTPTKQDFAFGDVKHGHIHEQNLYAWTGAFAHCYWEHFNDRAVTLTAFGKEVISHRAEAEKLVSSNICLPATFSQKKLFSTFEHMSFSINHRTSYIRCINRIGKDDAFDWVQREGGLIKFCKKGKKASTKNSRRMRPAVQAPRKKPPKKDVELFPAMEAAVSRQVMSVDPVDSTEFFDDRQMEDVKDTYVMQEDTDVEPDIEPDVESNSDAESELLIEKPVRKRRKTSTKSAIKKQAVEEWQEDIDSSNNELIRANAELKETIKSLQASLKEKDKRIAASIKTVKSTRQQLNMMVEQNGARDDGSVMVASISNTSQGGDAFNELEAKCGEQDEELQKLRRALEAHKALIRDLQSSNDSLHKLAGL